MLFESHPCNKMPINVSKRNQYHLKVANRDIWVILDWLTLTDSRSACRNENIVTLPRMIPLRIETDTIRASTRFDTSISFSYLYWPVGCGCGCGSGDIGSVGKSNANSNEQERSGKTRHIWSIWIGFVVVCLLFLNYNVITIAIYILRPEKSHALEIATNFRCLNDSCGVIHRIHIQLE